MGQMRTWVIRGNEQKTKTGENNGKRNRQSEDRQQEAGEGKEGETTRKKQTNKNWAQRTWEIPQRPGKHWTRKTRKRENLQGQRPKNNQDTEKQSKLGTCNERQVRQMRGGVRNRIRKHKGT